MSEYMQIKGINRISEVDQNLRLEIWSVVAVFFANAVYDIACSNVVVTECLTSDIFSMLLCGVSDCIYCI